MFKTIILTISAAAFGLGVAGLEAQAQQRHSPVTQFEAASGPSHGDCKAGYQHGIGASPAMAEAAWSQTVAAQFGTNWSIWVGAQNKNVQPFMSNGSQQWVANAQPCFYIPVR